MGFVFPKTPWLLKKAFSSYVWNLDEDEKVLYLTFDDGPTPLITEKALRILEEFDAKATFFCIGDNVRKYPDEFQRVIDAGHSIGNHTYNHLKGWKTDNDVYIENTLEAETVIQRFPIPNQEPKLFRPPYGKIGPLQGKALQKLGYTIVMWDVVSYDWEAEINPETCLDNVLSNTNKGSIIVFHDSVKASENMLYALPKTLEYYKERGFEFKAITADTLASTR